MPIEAGVENKGRGTYRYFMRYGKTGTRYYYNPLSPISRNIAEDRARKQGMAIRSSGFKEAKRVKLHSMTKRHR
jgi:hypothetical protein